jgi:dTDP-4-amino-4,6-dideoxygalactose transaminase
VKRPAILGGEPAFEMPLPFVRPSVPPLAQVTARVADSYDGGVLTNGACVRLLEERAAEHLGVAHAIAVASCTAGLMLVVRALEVTGPVVVPSFTFSASAHAVRWNGADIRFAECDATSFQVDPDHVGALAGAGGAIVATHVFGAPCEVETLEKTARHARVPLVCDAAHAFGARRGAQSVGSFGLAEVFSFSPTKPVVAGEGGIVATNDGALASAIATGRDYGNPGNYDTQFVGLNARMSELHAAIALESLAGLSSRLQRRAAIAKRYQVGLAGIPGVEVQWIAPGDQSTFKDFTVTIDEEAFGIPRDLAVAGLAADGICTRCYFSPPVHRQRAYSDIPTADLPITDAVASSVISLPIYESLSDARVDNIVDVLRALHHFASEVRTTTGE